MRKIAFIDLSPIRGGAEISFELILQKMNDKEDITLVISKDSEAFTDLKEIKTERIDLDKNTLFEKKNSILSPYSAIKIIIKGLKTKCIYEIIVTNTFKSHLFGFGLRIKNRRVKWIIYERDVPENIFIKLLKIFLHKQSNFVIFNSNYLKRKYGNVKTSEVIYNIIEANKLVSEKRDFKKFVFIGNLTYEKGFDRTLEVLEKIRKKIPEAILYVAGENGYGTIVTKRGQKNIIYLGYDEKRNCLKEAGFIILLNRRKESFSRAISEAMMCGIVPVLLRGNGMDEYAKENNALLFDSYDSENISDKIFNAINDGKTEDLSKNAKESINSLIDFETTIFKFGSVLDNLTNQE